MGVSFEGQQVIELEHGRYSSPGRKHLRIDVVYNLYTILHLPRVSFFSPHHQSRLFTRGVSFVIPVDRDGFDLFCQIRGLLISAPTHHSNKVSLCGVLA